MLNFLQICSNEENGQNGKSFGKSSFLGGELFILFGSDFFLFFYIAYINASDFSYALNEYEFFNYTFLDKSLTLLTVKMSPELPAYELRTLYRGEYSAYLAQKSCGETPVLHSVIQTLWILNL